MRVRLILAFALVVVAAIASFLLVARETVAFTVRSFISRGGMMGIETLASDLEVYYQQTGSWMGAEEVLDGFRMGRGRGMMGQGGMMMGDLRLRLASADGTFVADNQAAPQGVLSSREQSAAIALRDSQEAVVGYLLAEGGSSPDAEQELLNGLVRAGWIAAGIAGLLSLLLAFLLSYGLLKPVQDLTKAAALMASGDLSQRVPVRSKDELGMLGQSFNNMAVSLDLAEQHRRAMTADIAHELRTPIAIQRAHLEALQDGIYPLTAANLHPVLDQTELLTRLVEDLRTLALADAGELKLDRAMLDLGDLVRRVIERFRPEAENRGITLRMDPPGASQPFSVSGDAGRIEQILHNLVSNALRHTPSGGTVAVRVMREAGWLELQVMDSGTGIPPEALPRLFERFYRADRSRSREAGGSGLGLAIARQLALAHGGDVAAENRPEGGALFTLRLPTGSLAEKNLSH